MPESELSDSGFEVKQGHPSSRYLLYLPIIFQEEDGFLGRFLLGFEETWEMLEQRQDNLAMYFATQTAPPFLLSWLANWVGAKDEILLPENRLRTWLAEAVELYRWRGTKEGLAKMINACTGCKAEVNALETDPFVLQINITSSTELRINRDLVENLIRVYKPAHMGYTLKVR